jgi:2-polyprenyl-3-methyl-5-hydroxy-6-metoxy-1,4-benzoquinol methylase
MQKFKRRINKIKGFFNIQSEIDEIKTFIKKDAQIKSYELNKELASIKNSILELKKEKSELDKMSQNMTDYNKNIILIRKKLEDINERISLIDLRDLADEVDIEFNYDIEKDSITNMKFINRVFEVELQKNKQLLNKILSHKKLISAKHIGENDEQGLPTNADFLISDHYRTMLKRYFFAGKIFAENKTVLDSCSGLGWGTYILANYAKHVTAYDYNKEAIKLAKKNWQAKNIEWKVANALDKIIFPEESFEVITAMETIEHFTKNDGSKYIYNNYKMLKKNGFFIGTSLFPTTRKEANTSPVLLNNPFHLYLWTQNEIKEELEKYFSNVRIIGTWMFIAQK